MISHRITKTTSSPHVANTAKYCTIYFYKSQILILVSSQNYRKSHPTQDYWWWRGCEQFDTSSDSHAITVSQLTSK